MSLEKDSITLNLTKSERKTRSHVPELVAVLSMKVTFIRLLLATSYNVFFFFFFNFKKMRSWQVGREGGLRCYCGERDKKTSWRRDSGTAAVCSLFQRAGRGKRGGGEGRTGDGEGEGWRQLRCRNTLPRISVILHRCFNAILCHVTLMKVQSCLYLSHKSY